MHELGLVNYAVKEVSKIAEEHNVTKIKSVTLEFGEVSGIVTEYLYDYWKWYSKKFPMFEDSTLYCEEIPAVTWCDNCKIRHVRAVNRHLILLVILVDVSTLINSPFNSGLDLTDQFRRQFVIIGHKLLPPYRYILPATMVYNI